MMSFAQFFKKGKLLANRQITNFIKQFVWEYLEIKLVILGSVTYQNNQIPCS